MHTHPSREERFKKLRARMAEVAAPPRDRDPALRTVERILLEMSGRDVAVVVEDYESCSTVASLRGRLSVPSDLAQLLTAEEPVLLTVGDSIDSGFVVDPAGFDGMHGSARDVAISIGGCVISLMVTDVTREEVGPCNS